jgi:hypothetical protein
MNRSAPNTKTPNAMISGHMDKLEAHCHPIPHPVWRAAFDCRRSLPASRSRARMLCRAADGANTPILKAVIKIHRRLVG